MIDALVLLMVMALAWASMLLAVAGLMEIMPLIDRKKVASGLAGIASRLRRLARLEPANARGPLFRGSPRRVAAGRPIDVPKPAHIRLQPRTVRSVGAAHVTERENL